MHKPFILLAIAILFELNKVASSWRWWPSYGKCTGIFNTGNVSCGRHRAKTCSLCPCNQQGVHGHNKAFNWCNGDCQWSGDHLSGVCHMRRKTTKGEWHSRHIIIQGCCGGRGLGSVDLDMGSWTVGRYCGYLLPERTIPN